MKAATDWSSYDNIAARYDNVWGSRFEAVARSICERLPLTPGASVLDIGTGTGIVLHTFGSRTEKGALLTGCDRSLEMIQVARAGNRAGRFVAADAMALPFRATTFDAVTASFVLSHLRDHEAGLREARRVLKPGGLFAMSSWAADTDPHAEAWRELLADLVPKQLLQAAVARVAPHESEFQSATGVEGALTAGGFTPVEVHALGIEYTLPLEHFLADREISSGGRFARHRLGADAWARFVAHAREQLGHRFGSVFECSRGVLIGLGTRAA